MRLSFHKALAASLTALLIASLSIVTATSLAAYLTKGENKITLDFQSESIGTTYFDGIDSDGYYKISDASHLRNLQKLVSLGAFGANDKFILTQDIAWSGDDLAPIGTDDMPFISVFEGNGHVINDLVVDGKDSADIGMFGYVGMEGSLQNFFLDHPTIKVSANTDGGAKRTANPLADILDEASKAIALPTHSESGNTFSTPPSSITGTDGNTYEITWRSTDEDYLYNDGGTWTTKWGGEDTATDNVNVQLVGTVYGLVDDEVAAYAVERFQITVTPDGLISDETAYDESGENETAIGIYKTLWQQDGNSSQEDHATYVGLIAGHIDGFADYIGIYGGTGTDVDSESNARIIVDGRPAKSSMVLVGRSRSDSYLDSGYSHRMRIYVDFTKNVTGLKDADGEDYDPISKDYFEQIHEWETTFNTSRSYSEYSAFSSKEDAESGYQSALSQYDTYKDDPHDYITPSNMSFSYNSSSGSGTTDTYGFAYTASYAGKYDSSTIGFSYYQSGRWWSQTTTYGSLQSSGTWPSIASVQIAFTSSDAYRYIKVYSSSDTQVSSSSYDSSSGYYVYSYDMGNTAGWKIQTSSTTAYYAAYIYFTFSEPNASNYVFKGDPDDDLVEEEYTNIHETAKSITQSFIDATDASDRDDSNEYFRIYPSLATAGLNDGENYLRFAGPLEAGTYTQYAASVTGNYTNGRFTWSTVRDFYVENGLWLWPTSDQMKVSEDEKFYVTYNLTYSAKNGTTGTDSYSSSDNAWRILYNGYNDANVYTMKYTNSTPSFPSDDAEVLDNYDNYNYFLDNKIRSATWWDLTDPKTLDTTNYSNPYAFEAWVSDTENIAYPDPVSIIDDGEVHHASITLEMSMLNALASTENTLSSGGYYPIFALGIGSSSGSVIHDNTTTTTAGTGRQRGYSFYPSASSSNSAPYYSDKQFFHDYFAMNDEGSFELDLYNVEVVFSNRAGNVTGNVRNCDFLYDMDSCLDSWDSSSKTFSSWNVLSGVKPTFSVTGTDTANYYFWRTGTSTSNLVHGRYDNESYALSNTDGYASADVEIVS